MNSKRGAQDLADAELDAAQGGGLMDTPLGGWGVAADDNAALEPVSNVLKNRTQTATGSARNVN